MKLDMRCMQETVRRNTACAGAVKLYHYPGCDCQTQRITISHKQAIVLNTHGNPHYCPCGLPQHKGECRDAAREAAGLEPVKWQP